MDWIEFVTSMIVFLASHSVPLRPSVRQTLTRVLGERVFILSYSVLSIGVLWWIIVAAGRAPYIELWEWQSWQSSVAITLMFFACQILAFSIARPNPFSFGGRKNETFEPSQPGIIRIIRHPILIALALWSIAHLIANGNLAHGILFGTFTIFSIAGVFIIDRRKRLNMGSKWHQLYAETMQSPVLSAGWSDHSPVLRLSAGLILWMSLMLLHPQFAGVHVL
ncbi:MAG: NnrU family protein [Pseudomonadota bacterium]